MAQVLALIPDLLFGSQIQGMLSAAGYDVELATDSVQAEKRLAGLGGDSRPAVLIIDLDSGEFDGFEFVRERRDVGALAGTRTLGLYPHVDVDTRNRAYQAEFDCVVPRSRIAREGAVIVSELIQGDTTAK